MAKELEKIAHAFLERDMYDFGNSSHPSFSYTVSLHLISVTYSQNRTRQRQSPRQRGHRPVLQPFVPFKQFC